MVDQLYKAYGKIEIEYEGRLKNLEKKFDIRNFNIKKSTAHQNRFWKKETVKKINKLIKDDMKSSLIDVDSFNNKKSKNANKNK